MSYHQFMDRTHSPGYRGVELQKLIHAINARENRLVIALPGMGASNLLRYLVSNSKWSDRQVYFAHINYRELGKTKDQEALFAEIAHQLEEQRVSQSTATNKFGYDQLRDLLKHANESLSEEDRLVMVIDEANRLYEAADRDFYLKLKALTDMNKRVCWIMATMPRYLPQIDPDNVLFAARRLFIGPFTAKDFADAVTEEAKRLNVTFEESHKWQLLRLTGGHPGLLRAVSSAVVDESLALTGMIEVLVQNLITLESVQYRCNKMWQELAAAEQQALYLCGQGQADEVAAATKKWLHNLGLLVEPAFQLFSPLFAAFVSNKMPLEDEETEPILVPITIVGATTMSINGKEIIMAGKVFCGQKEIHVAPLELRLIACLSKAPRIFSFNEIADYVYYQDKGGTAPEQVANLVRQVRKRLGDSRYIKTHWGQGYELKDSFEC